MPPCASPSGDLFPNRPNVLVHAILRGPVANTQGTATSATPSRPGLFSGIPELAGFIERSRAQELQGLQRTLDAVVHGAKWEAQSLEEAARNYPHNTPQLDAKAKEVLGQVTLARKGARRRRAFYRSPTFALYAALVWYADTTRAVLDGLRGDNARLRKELEDKLHLAELAAEIVLQRVAPHLGLKAFDDTGDGPWSRPAWPSEWARVFRCSVDTLERHVKDGSLKIKKVSPTARKWRLRVMDLPPESQPARK